MEVDIAGEDAVTQAIIERLIKDYRSDILIKQRRPVRGSQLKKFAPNYNRLGSPIIILTDLDNENCPPSLIKNWFNKEPLNDNLLFRIAQEEAETWLMADRQGFSKWLSVNIALIPEPNFIDKKKNIFEITFPYKPSLYMMYELASKSPKTEIKSGLIALEGAKKGPGYNTTLLPFIENIWNVENAMKNSYSLYKAVTRLRKFKL